MFRPFLFHPSRKTKKALLEFNGYPTPGVDRPRRTRHRPPMIRRWYKGPFIR